MKIEAEISKKIFIIMAKHNKYHIYFEILLLGILKTFTVIIFFHSEVEMASETHSSEGECNFHKFIDS